MNRGLRSDRRISSGHLAASSWTLWERYARLHRSLQLPAIPRALAHGRQPGAQDVGQSIIALAPAMQTNKISATAHPPTWRPEER